MKSENQSKKKFLNIPLVRRFLGFLSKTDGNLSSLERALLSYGEQKLSLIDVPAYALIETIRRATKLNKKNMSVIARDIFLRKAAVLYAQSIARFGVTSPQKYVAPHHVIWNITDFCNIGTCKYCYQNSTTFKLRDELSLERKLQLVNEFGNTGVGYVILGGGEPLTSKDLLVVAEEIIKRGIGVGIATNGILLSEGISRRLKEIGVRTINISLNGSESQIHNSLTSKEDCWSRSVRAIGTAKKYGLRVETNSVILPENFSDLESLINFSISLGVDGIKLFPIIPTGRGKELKQLDKEQLVSLVDVGKKYLRRGINVFVTDPRYTIWLEREIEQMHYLAHLTSLLEGCYAGRIYCAIQPNGIVTPCPFLPIEAGDVKKESFSSIWKNSEVFRKLRNRDNLKGRCGKCRDKDYCGGCRGKTYALTGNYLESDPSCFVYSELALVKPKPQSNSQA